MYPNSAIKGFSWKEVVRHEKQPGEFDVLFIQCLISVFDVAAQQAGGDNPPRHPCPHPQILGEPVPSPVRALRVPKALTGPAPTPAPAGS